MQQISTKLEEVTLPIDFFEATQETSRDLNQTERQLFDYVVKHMHEVKDMSIQKFAAEMFLSTTTIFRFTQKLGFSGYADFINSLMITFHNKQFEVLPSAILREGYNKEYLKNATETVRVMSEEKANHVADLLAKRPNIYILTDDNTHPIAQYCEKLFIGLGLHAYAPEATYQMQNLANQVTDDDMLIALSYSGQDAAMLEFINRVFLDARPFLVSITRADNNILESLSDCNFYIFAEEIMLNEMDLTSCVPMLMILELLAYTYINRAENGSENTVK